ncbi:MAG: hypothetical protein M3380_10640, partial [Chloroflexota bacterium]|nr:hypothetical protein [Chloroflexota bacterium]
MRSVNHTPSRVVLEPGQSSGHRRCTKGVDIFHGFFAGKKGDRYTRLADWVMRSSGEGPTYAVHTAQVLDSRRVLEMDYVVRVKSIADILNKRVDLNSWERRGFEVWRCRTLSDEQREALTDQALRYIN